MTFIAATNVVARRPPERRLTGAPTARAKSANGLKMSTQKLFCGLFCPPISKRNCNIHKKIRTPPSEHPVPGSFIPKFGLETVEEELQRA